LLTFAQTNWNFHLHELQKKFNTKFRNRLKKNVNINYQRLLTFVVLFILNAFINVYYFLDV